MLLGLTVANTALYSMEDRKAKNSVNKNEVLLLMWCREGYAP